MGGENCTVLRLRLMHKLAMSHMGFYPARAATTTLEHGSFALDANMSTPVHYPAHSEDKDQDISWDNL